MGEDSASIINRKLDLLWLDNFFCYTLSGELLERSTTQSFVSHLKKQKAISWVGLKVGGHTQTISVTPRTASTVTALHHSSRGLSRGAIHFDAF